MSEGQRGEHLATVSPPTTTTITTTAGGQEPASAKPARKRKHARAQPQQTASKTWSARLRRKGADIFLSGYKTEEDIEQELCARVTALRERGTPYGKGPEQTSVGQALQDHALTHLPSLKGADQESRRINKYLRAARLATLELRPMSEVTNPSELPKGAQVGRYFAVWLKPYTSARAVPKGLTKHRKQLLTRTADSDRLRAVLATTKMAKVTYELVQQLVRQMEAENLAKATVLQEVALLRRLFYHASHKWHWIAPAKNPACKLKFTGALTQRERVMSKQEQTRLDDALETCMNDLVAPAFQLMTETAMRADECLTAKWGGVNWEKRLLRLEDAKAGPRNVPLSPRAIEILKGLGPSDDPKKKIIGISYEALKAAWRRACERAGVGDLHIHDLRHTAATRMALKSGNIFIVQKLTGHKTIEMVKRYVNVKAEDVVALMHAPEPAPQPASQVASAAAPAALNAEALQAAMQMLQAAAAQLNAKPAAAPEHRPTHAANDAGQQSAAA